MNWNRIVESIILIGIIFLIVIDNIPLKIDNIESINDLINYIDISKIIATSGTATIGYFSWKAYQSIVVNKVSEGQLEEVVNFIETLKKTYVTVYIQSCPDETTVNQHLCKKEVNIIELAKNYHTVKKEYQSKQIKVLVPGKAMTDLRIKNIYSYENKVLIPSNIVNIIKRFTLNYKNKYLEELYIDKNERIKNSQDKTLLEFKKILEEETETNINKDQIKNRTPLLEIKDEKKNNYSKYSFAIMVDINDHRDIIQSLNQIKEDPYNSFTRIPVKYLKNTEDGKKSAYYNWVEFHKSCYDLVKETRKWLDKNNVKDINLPDL